MNNLGYLRKHLKLTYRALEKECGIDRSTLNLLEKGKQKLTESRINTLCSFYNVSSDFMIGKSDYGIFVELTRNDFTAISKDEYEKYLLDGSLKEYIEFNQVRRIPNEKLERKLDPNANKDKKEEVLSELNDLDNKEIQKVINFIKDYIKK